MAARRAASASIAALAAGSAALAHHSPAAFDMTEPVVVEGTVADIAWRNPHVYLTIETTGADGTSVLQTIEAASVGFLDRLGVSRTTLSPGERVSVRAFPNRRGGSRMAFGVDLTTEDGAVLPLSPLSDRAEIAPAPDNVSAESIAGRWMGSNESWVTASRSVETLSLTPEGQAAVANRSIGNPEADCIPFGAPALMLSPTVKTIEVGADAVVLTIDTMGGVRRVVHMDGQPHPSDLAPSVEGHSVGRWEGETLVVDTIGHAADRDWVLPTTEEKHVVERLALTEDRRHIEYEVTVEDPEYLTEPVTFRQTWDYRPDLEPFGAACDPETAARFLEAEE